MAKIIYFTEGEKATTEELADIALFNAAAQAPYEVVVRRGDDVASYAYGHGNETTDYVAGSVPEAYADETKLEPDNIPIPGIDYETQAIVSDGDTLEEAGGGTIAVAIVDGVATYTYTAGE